MREKIETDKKFKIRTRTNKLLEDTTRLNSSDLRNTVLSQMQGNRWDHLSRDLPQVLVRAIYGL